MQPPAVELSDVTVRAGSTTILRGADLTLVHGESVGLFGPNGSGKTTLLRVLATLKRPSAGTGRILGADLSTSERFAVRPLISLVGHVPTLYPELTIAENTRFAASVMGRDESDAAAALTAVGLSAAGDRRSGSSSHGMQRRAEFARVLLARPQLLLLDEPHNTLDADAAGLVELVVRRTLDDGGSAVLVSHDRERVGSLVGRAVELKGGKLV